MTTSLQRILDSTYGLNLASFLGRSLPPQLGHRLARFAADQIARSSDSLIVRVMRANQWVVSGDALHGEALDKAVQETFHHAARSIFDLYHYISNPDAAGRLIVLDETAQGLIQRAEFEPRGLVVVGLHLSCYDLVLQWMCQKGIRPLVLTIPDPQGGRRMEYEIRKRTGMNLLPASVGAFRQALRHLQHGGFVATGIDRPIPNPPAWPHFFGRPAALPMHHIFLAQKAQVPIVIMVTNQMPDGKYHVFASDLIEMDPYPDREIGALRNAEKVLTIAESFIRQAPHQWTMSLPVWPQVLDLVPS